MEVVVVVGFAPAPGQHAAKAGNLSGKAPAFALAAVRRIKYEPPAVAGVFL